MTAKRETGERFSLSRWSRRKLDTTPPASAPTPPLTAPVPTLPMTASPAPAASTVAAELPAVETLSFESDFTVFLKPEVDANLKRAALKQLFRDPRFAPLAHPLPREREGEGAL